MERVALSADALLQCWLQRQDAFALDRHECGTGSGGAGARDRVRALEMFFGETRVSDVYVAMVRTLAKLFLVSGLWDFKQPNMSAD